MIIDLRTLLIRKDFLGFVLVNKPNLGATKQRSLCSSVTNQPSHDFLMEMKFVTPNEFLLEGR